MAKTQTERAIIDLVINGQQAKTTLKEITLATSRQRAELQKLKEADDPAMYKAKLAEYHKMLAAQKDMRQRIDDTTTAWGRFKKEMATVTVGVVGGNVITFMLQQLAALIPSTIDKTMKLADSMADIEKATGLSAEGVKKLNKELKAIDTRTTNQELRDIAIAGGQLGVANDQLVGFVKNVDMAVVALGDEFSGGVDEVAKSLGGIGKLFDETRGMEAGKVINDVGSALNELGAAGSATSPVVAEFTTRMGQLGGLAPKLAETMGLGAAMQELGLSAEIASSGLSGLMLTAANRSALFAQHLGMSKTAVEELINTSPNDFLMTLAKSFEGLAPAQVAQRLKELKVESQESIKVMSLLAGQTDLVREKQALATKAMAEGSSLADEFAKKNHQLARDLKELKEWFNSLLTSEGLQNFLVAAIHNTVEFIKVLPQVGNWLGKNAEWITMVVIPALLAYNATLIKSTAATVANTVAETYRKVAYEVGFRWLMLSSAAQSAYTTVMAASTVQARIAALAQITLNGVVTTARGIWIAFNAVLLANPIGLVVAAMTALVAAVKYFSENTEKAARVAREKISIQNQLKIATELHARAQQQINEKIGRYNELSASERANLEKTIALKKLEAMARLASLKVRARENALQAAELNYWEKTKIRVANTFGSVTDIRRDFLKQQQENMRSAYSESLQGAEGLEGEIAAYDAQIREINGKKTGKATGNGKLNTITDPEEKSKKAQSEADKAKAEAKRNADELERMLGDSRERIMAGEKNDYQKEVADFADKYTRMYELAANNQAKIDEIRAQSLVEFEEIDRRRKAKEDEDARKQAEKDNKEGFGAALGAADQTRADAQAGIDRQAGLVSQDDIRLQELEADQVYLTQKLLLEQTFAQESAETQRQLTENWNAQVKIRAQTEVQYAEQMKQAERALQDAKRSAMAEGIGVLKGFLKQGTLAYKAAIVAQKAFAIAQVIVDTQREVAQIYANPAWSLMPDGGLTLKTATATAAKIRAGISIATIAATGVQEIAAKADGGYTGMRELYPGAGGPAGFTGGPTLFNMGKRSYIAGEAGREFVISNKALQNPVVADFARVLDSMQRSGNYGAISNARSSYTEPVGPLGIGSGIRESSSGGMSADVGAAILRELQMNRQAMVDIAKRPIQNNYRLFEEFEDEVTSIRTENVL